MKKFSLIFFIYLNLFSLFVSKAIANETDFVQWECYESSEENAKLVLKIGYLISSEDKGASIGYLTLETNKKSIPVIHKIKGIRDVFYWEDEDGGNYSIVMSGASGKSFYYDLSLPNKDKKTTPEETLDCINKKIIKVDKDTVEKALKIPQIAKKGDLSAADIDKIASHVASCFNINPYLMDYDEIVDLKVSLNKNNEVSSVQIVDKSKYIKDKRYRVLADTARRAVIDCSPLPVQKEKLHLFDTFIMSFNSKF